MILNHDLHQKKIIQPSKQIQNKNICDMICIIKPKTRLFIRYEKEDRHIIKRCHSKRCNKYICESKY